MAKKPASGTAQPTTPPAAPLPASPRTDKGRFKRGHSGNPAGRSISPYQDFQTRARHWLETKTAAEIISLAKDGKAMLALSVYDHMIVKRITKALTMEGEQTMERLLDRVLGRPTFQLNVDQNLNAKITDETPHHFSVSEIDQWLESLAGEPEKANSPAPLPH